MNKLTTTSVNADYHPKQERVKRVVRASVQGETYPILSKFLLAGCAVRLNGPPKYPFPHGDSPYGNGEAEKENSIR
jgi:hypothetical protein